LHKNSGANISHHVTKQVTGARWRRTGFVEVQVPIFSRAAFADCSRLFVEAGPAGWGLESYWGARFRCGILDATPVRHTRGVGRGTPYKGLEGIDLLRQAAEFRKKHRVGIARHKVFETVR